MKTRINTYIKRKHPHRLAFIARVGTCSWCVPQYKNLAPPTHVCSEGGAYTLGDSVTWQRRWPHRLAFVVRVGHVGCVGSRIGWLLRFLFLFPFPITWFVHHESSARLTHVCYAYRLPWVMTFMTHVLRLFSLLLSCGMSPYDSCPCSINTWTLCTVSLPSL